MNLTGKSKAIKRLEKYIGEEIGIQRDFINKTQKILTIKEKRDTFNYY